VRTRIVSNTDITEDFYTRFTSSDVYKLLDSVPDTLLIVEGNSNKILFASSNATITTGYTIEQLRAMVVEDLLPEQLREHHVALRSGFQAAPETRWMGQNRGSLLMRRSNGEIRKIEAQLNPLTLAGTCVILAWVRDITDRRIDFDEAKLVRAMLALYTEATTPEMRLHRIVSTSDDARVDEGDSH
jgi:PAS domain S-box-containing protein